MPDLQAWNDTPTTRAIMAFVTAATREGDPGYIPTAERIAVFDNDGTLWSEKPMPVQLDFIVRSFAAAAERDPEKRHRQPYQAAYERDPAWMGRAMVKHYQGDDGDLKLLIGALSEISAGVEVEDYGRQVLAFFEQAEHPTLRRPYLECGFVPMVELLRYLEANELLTFIVSGGDRDFMRPAAERIYGIPRERVVGSGFGIEYSDGKVLYTAKLDAFDDGPQKPLHIWARTGRRPVIAGGNSNGDLEMLRFAGGEQRPALRLVVRHDDAEREVDDQAGAERVLGASFTEISMRDLGDGLRGVIAAGFLPGWLRGYRRGFLRPDATAGLVVWSVVTPQAVAYAQIAGLPPAAGLMAAPGALVAYAWLGTSRQLVVSATTATAAVSAAAVGPLANGDVARFAASAGLALLAAVVLIVAGALRLGVIADSSPSP